MDESVADAQQAIAASPAPAAEFRQLSPQRQREVFFQLPATSATIFITTATDVLGFFIFLGLAQAIL